MLGAVANVAGSRVVKWGAAALGAVLVAKAADWGIGTAIRSARGEPFAGANATFRRLPGPMGRTRAAMMDSMFMNPMMMGGVYGAMNPMMMGAMNPMMMGGGMMPYGGMMPFMGGIGMGAWL